MEKMKIGIVTVAALALVSVAVSVLVINSGIVLAVGPGVTAHIGAVLKLTQQGDDVLVEVKAQGLASDADFTVRAYISTVTNCMRGMPNAIFDFDVTSDRQGNLRISQTILDNPTGNTPGTVVVDDVGSVSIRSEGGPGTNPPVVCFQDTT